MRKISIFFILLLLFGCHSSQAEKEKIARVNLGNEPHTLDPRCAREPSSLTLCRMLFEGLTRIGPSDAPELALAKSVGISGDLCTYTFRLREAVWSNGSPVRAQDFVYAWRSVLSPQFHADNAFQLYVLKNAKEVKRGAQDPETLGVFAPDDHTLIVELEYPTPYFLELLAFPAFYPVHEETDRLSPHWSQKVETYVSNGPFLLTKWRHSDELVVRKNETYWDADQVQLDGLSLLMLEEGTEMRLFEKGKLHWAGSPLSTLPVDALPSLFHSEAVKKRQSAETCFLRTNVTRGPLAHPKVRRALALAIDRAAIVQHVLQGGQLVATGLTPPSMSLSKEPYFSDGAKSEALALMTEALEDLGLEALPPLQFSYIGSERMHHVAQAIQDQWRDALGVAVELEALERKVYFDKVSHSDYDLAISSWGADFNDPINFLEVFKYRAMSTNNTGWEDPKYAKMLSDSHLQIDPAKRVKLLAASEKLLMDAMPIIPIFHYTMLYRQDGALQGVFLSSLGHLDFKWATLDNEPR